MENLLVSLKVLEAKSEGVQLSLEIERELEEEHREEPCLSASELEIVAAINLRTEEKSKSE